MTRHNRNNKSLMKHISCLYLLLLLFLWGTRHPLFSCHAWTHYSARASSATTTSLSLSSLSRHARTATATAKTAFRYLPLSLTRNDEMEHGSPPVTTTQTAPTSTTTTTTTSRRSWLSTAASSVSFLTTSLVAEPVGAKQTQQEKQQEDDTYWPLWPALPVYPYAYRQTLRQQAAPGVWTFDQLIGIYYVQTPIRMTVVSLGQKKGLLVYAPVAATQQCLDLLQPLIKQEGPIRYIVLPSVAVEHKVLAGPFARKFPDAEFYVTDQQYSFPLSLPNAFLGLPSWTKPLPSSSKDADMWDGALEHEVLTIQPGVASMYQDVAMYHKASNTLLVCDALFATTENAPAILQQEPTALLFHARESRDEIAPDTLENRQKGWRRIVLLFNFFFPRAGTADLGLAPLLNLNPRYPLGWGGWMPYTWDQPELERVTFDAYAGNGAPIIYPVVQIILSRGHSGQALREWVQKVCAWPFERVIPAHLDAPLKLGPKEFAQTFAFASDPIRQNVVRYCDEDVKFLRQAEEGFLNFSVFKSDLGVLRGQECTGGGT